MAESQPHAAEGFFSKGEDIHTSAEPVQTTTVHPKGLSEHERSGASLRAVETGNEVLESNAQSKGRWFQYLKTKQFWLTLLLGQGTFYTPTPHVNDSSTNTHSPRYLHYQHEHTLFAPRQ
jgi:hypothetical protein